MLSVCAPSDRSPRSCGTDRWTVARRIWRKKCTCRLVKCTLNSSGTGTADSSAATRKSENKKGHFVQWPCALPIEHVACWLLTRFKLFLELTLPTINGSLLTGRMTDTCSILASIVPAVLLSGGKGQMRAKRAVLPICCAGDGTVSVDAANTRFIYRGANQLIVNFFHNEQWGLQSEEWDRCKGFAGGALLLSRRNYNRSTAAGWWVAGQGNRPQHGRYIKFDDGFFFSLPIKPNRVNVIYIHCGGCWWKTSTNTDWWRFVWCLMLLRL